MTTPTLESFVATHAPRFGRIIAMIRAAANELDAGEPVARVSRRLRDKLTRELQHGDRIPRLLAALQKWDTMNEPEVFSASLRLESQRLETGIMHLIADLLEVNHGRPRHDN